MYFLHANVEGGQCSLSTVTMHWYRLDKRKGRRKETKKETKKETNKLGEI